MKKLNKNFSIIVCIITVFVITIIILFFGFKTNKQFTNIYISNDIKTAKQISSFLLNSLKEFEKTEKITLTVGSVEMRLDKNRQGEVQVILVEEFNKNPKIIFADLDTSKNILYSVKNQGTQKKLYPGKIDLQNWVVDSDDAIKITENFYENEDEFKYDEIFIKTCDYYNENAETWDVFLLDKQKGIRYSTRINPYTKEILQHTIEQYQGDGSPDIKED